MTLLLHGRLIHIEALDTLILTKHATSLTPAFEISAQVWNNADIHSTSIYPAFKNNIWLLKKIFIHPSRAIPNCPSLFEEE